MKLTHAELDAPMTRDEAMTHGEDKENTGQTACDIGFSHGGLMMVFMSIMSFGFEDERAKQEREEERESKMK